MTDGFALLGLDRRPWLEEENVKARFLALSADCHPDRVHARSAEAKAAAQARFVELNAAYQCLREPRERLRHLLELETGQRPQAIDTAPEGLMDLFLEVGRVCREVDGFLTERARTASPLLRIPFLERDLEWRDRLSALRRRIENSIERLNETLRALDAAWATAPPPGDPARPAALPLATLDQVYRELSYLTRWRAQLQDRAAQLAF